ncbi:MAG: HAMP domain-containing histidine kinase [Candidatus Dormibacteraeota bacterium]|nr:HAMP domain-containing histidine kinase [Candidatus Dormibacteraeota bacterium]
MKIDWRIARVAGIGATVVLVLYAVVVSAIDLSYFRSRISDADSRLAARIATLARDFRDVRSPGSDGTVPIYSWLYSLDGTIAGATPGAPPLPDGLHPAGPTSVDTGSHHYRVASVPIVDVASPNRQIVGWLVVGRNVDDIYQATTSLVFYEALLAVPLAMLVFLGAVWIARRAVAPVEEARRRQLAFTADASHELRTPLTVIEAEASLALLQDRDAGSYRQSIERIASEGARLRRIVEDLLWLARFESEPKLPESGTVDVGQVAIDSVARFSHVADRRGIRMTGSVTAPQPPLIAAPPEWIDRLAGVLVDNACRYSPEGGSVNVSVLTGDGRVRLAVDDAGPGIPPAERPHIFDRFHRANNTPGGAGLGLAIGNAIVTATGGRWEVTESPAGGARMAVHWPLVRGPREVEPPVAARPASGPVTGLGVGASTHAFEERRQHPR